MKPRSKHRIPTTLAMAATAALWGGCDPEEHVVGSDSIQKLSRIDEVDILIVQDSSASIEPAVERLKAQLPRMVNAIVSGTDEDTDQFPPASSVNVAVATGDMGLGLEVEGVHGCSVTGDDGVFLTPAEAELSCDVSYPGFLSFDRNGMAPVATVDSVACVPLAGVEGCGFEQPLEAALKALWPSGDDRVEFLHGDGHGTGNNAGFLRPGSLLVVVVVTNEDDCSAADPALLDLSVQDYGPVNTRCAFNDDLLHDVQRYVSGLRQLREDGGDVVFGLIGGVPPAVLDEAFAMRTDLTSEEQAEKYYAHILGHPAMQAVVTDPGSPAAGLVPSCVSGTLLAFPPRRLVETAAAFGTRGVVGSLCEEDFGSTTGALLRSIGDRLREAAGEGDAG